MFWALLAAFALVLFAVPSAFAAEAGDLSLTIVYDNHSFNKELQTDWGFACFITGTEKTILFDTGTKASILLGNMEKLGIDPQSVELMAFSHLHGDHTAAALDFWKENSNVTVYVPKSWSESVREKIKNTVATCVEFDKPVQLCERVHSTEDMGTGSRQSGTAFGVSAKGELREQALVIETEKGLVVVTGCAHPGILKIVRRAKEIFNEDIYLVMGGFHLLRMSNQAIKDLIAEMKNEGVKKVAPTHCTGDLAISLFKEEYGENFIAAGVGKEIKIEGAFTAPE